MEKIKNEGDVLWIVDLEGGDDANNCLRVLERTRSEGPATFSAA